MKILCLSNFYPPHNFGGMEQSCQAVVEALRERGHTVRILTSSHRADRMVGQRDVARRLNLQMDLSPWRNAWAFLSYRRRRMENEMALQQAVIDLQPDVIFIWGMWNLDRGLARFAEELMGGRVLYRFADYWATLPSQRRVYWQAEGKNFLTKLVKSMIAPLALSYLADDAGPQPQFRQGYCVSAAVRRQLTEQGIPIGHMPVIHTGFELAPYLNDNLASKWSQPGHAGKLLFAGRLTREKGADVLLRAVADISRSKPEANFDLTLLGSGDPDYVCELHRLARRLNVDERIEFVGQVGPEEVVRCLGSHGVVVVPSVWQDPLPRIAIEAMAAGCVVVGSETGGLQEIIRDGVTGYLFPVGNERALAGRLLAIFDRGAGARQLAEAARMDAVDRFSLDAMMPQLEPLLEAASHRSQRRGGESRQTGVSAVGMNTTVSDLR